MKFDLEKLEFIECDIDSNKLAISGSDRDLTWGEFCVEVEVMKQKILSYNLPQGHPVIIYGHKEANFIVSIVACMSLKMPYIPVDVIYPLDRLNNIIKITNSSLVIDTKNDKIIFNKKNNDIAYYFDDQIIYIIFTSGSTGEPKGVQITKSSILDFNRWLKEDFDFNNNSIFMNQAPFSFDLSVYELIGFLLNGGSIILNEKKITENIEKFINRIKKYKCNTWISTPSFISKLLFSNIFDSNNLMDLNKFIFCGEVLPAVTVKRIYKNFYEPIIINSYGPTEATVATTKIIITKELLQKYPKNLPVGYVKKNTIINILNPDKNGIGEIEIIGNNVSIGYFKNEKLNKERFGNFEGKRTFKTGDFGYFEDDLLFFSERKDDLVKLHGYRIELLEIDNEIIKIKDIKNVVTIPLKRGKEVLRLVSFYLSDDKNIQQDSIKKVISKKLPYYMIPSEIIRLEDFPYNINHKIDKKALIEIYKGL